MTMRDLNEILAIAMPVFGHISFALTFASYAQRDIIRLRLIAVASLVLGLAYNLWINAHMPGDDNIWLVIGWLAVFALAPWSLVGLSIWLMEGPADLDYRWAVPTAFAASLASLALSVWGFVEIGLLRGTPGPNRFGPPPE